MIKLINIIYFINLFNLINGTEIYKIETRENDTFTAKLNLKLEENKENEIKFEFSQKLKEFFIDQQTVEPNKTENNSNTSSIYIFKDWNELTPIITDWETGN